MSASYDAVVIGAGHNGLVAAATLADAGLSVLVVERAEVPGGALCSGELTLPGYVHDLFATNVNLFLASSFYAQHGAELERLGFVPETSPRPFANAFPGGRALGVTTDRAQTLAELEAHHPSDALGWEALDAMFERLAPTLFSLYATRVPSWAMARAITGSMRRLGRDGAVELARLLVSSCRELVDEQLASEEAKALVAPWGLHLDFGPDVAGGAVFPFLEAFSDQRSGMSVARGGASRLVDALVGMLERRGGVLRTSTQASRVVVSDGRAVGVELAGGERVRASRAVVASVTPQALAGQLLGDRDLPAQARRALGSYRYGPATMMLHLALSGPVPWAAGDRLRSFAYVHLAPYVDDLARAYCDALSGRLPAEPLLVVGQTSAVDPTRAPEGGHVVWVQVRPLPRRIAEDPEGPLAGRTWDEAKTAYAQRVMGKLERYAPGVSGLVRGRAVLSPADLVRHDVNLVDGDSISGSMHLRQNFLLRPALGFSGYRTPVQGLWMIGSATWPGAGLNAVSGQEAARAILTKLRGRLHGGTWCRGVSRNGARNGDARALVEE
ncbi:MAG: NAD(P)/FAD-dependent oxidoreductase [Actinomycetota bacterium]|nr:NAD(P)/FAD-dependent oxidoreductase [Actinomycetota bacterium]